MKAVVFAYSNVGDRCLRVLAAGGVEVALVVTHRDHPGETLWFARVADTAAELGLETVYAEDLSPEAMLARVEQAGAELIFSFYYRAMLPAAILALAPQGAFNMHGSLLPMFRGRAPTNWAVLKGATETGATLHEMTVKPDAGDIIGQSAVPILPDDTAEQVFDKVCVAAEQVLWRVLPSILAGEPPRLPNELGRGSYYSGRKPEDGRIDWTRPAAEVYNLIRAVAPPYPGAFTDVGGERLVIGKARRLPANGSGSAKASTSTSTGVAANPSLIERRHIGSPREPGLAIDKDNGCVVGVCGDGGLIAVHELLSGGERVDAARLSRLLDQRTESTAP